MLQIKKNSLLVLLGQHGLKLNAVHLSYITDGVPLFIIHEVKTNSKNIFFKLLIFDLRDLNFFLRSEMMYLTLV